MSDLRNPNIRGSFGFYLVSRELGLNNLLQQNSVSTT